MTNITVENIIAYSKIADALDIEKISEKAPGFMYDPNEFTGLTIKLNAPNVAILLFPDGKAICTGAKNLDDIDFSIKEVVNKLRRIGIKIKSKTDIEIQNIIASFDLGKELNLSSISKALNIENTSIEQDKFPGLVYKMDELGATLLIFSSGKIVCIGVKKLEDASKAIEILKEKISTLEI